MKQKMKIKYLKIIAFFALVIILLQSCGGNVYPTEESNKNNNKLKRVITSSRYTIFIVDSCEYIKIEGQYGVSHKGNCKFCEERRRRENNKY